MRAIPTGSSSNLMRSVVKSSMGRGWTRCSRSARPAIMSASLRSAFQCSSIDGARYIGREPGIYLSITSSSRSVVCPVWWTGPLTVLYWTGSWDQAALMSRTL